MKRFVLPLLIALAATAPADAAKKQSYYRVGNAADAAGVMLKGGVVLMGGSTDVDAAFQWMCGLAGHGDFLIVRASGTDAYNPYVQQFNLTLQRELVGGLVFNAGYVGALSRHVVFNYNADLALPGPGAINPRRQYFAQMPNVTVIQRVSSQGIQNYHSFQTGVERRFSKGFSLATNYTWSHNTDNNPGLGGGLRFNTYFPQLVNDFKNERGDSDVDVRQRFNVVSSYRLPFGSNLKGVAGVTEVNSFGGYLQEYQVLVDPDRLLKYDLPLEAVHERIRTNNSNVGGSIVAQQSEQYIIRGVGLIRSEDDIRKIVLKSEGGTPVYVGDLGEVRMGHAVRQGAAMKNGTHEVVGGIVMMLRGENSRFFYGEVHAWLKKHLAQ